jgi:hypothetical protein
MTKKEQGGHWLNVILGVLTGISWIFAACAAFGTTRFSDDYWDDAALIGMGCFFGMVSVALFGLSWLAFIFSRSSRWFIVLSSLSLSIILAFVLAGTLGNFLWKSEFDQNRALADWILAAIQQYREVHGYYPNSLADLNPPVPTTYHYRGWGRRFSYQREGSTFSFGYGYGWYFYFYDPSVRRWERRD